MEQAKHTLDFPRISSFHRKGVKLMMITKSILVQSFVDKKLEVARQKFEQNGFLQAVMCVRIAGDNTLEMSLMMPDTFEKKAKYLWDIGYYLHERGLQPSEAVMVSGISYIPADQPPSDNPSWHEAIVAIGRNADDSRYTRVAQPFTRDKHNRPIWQVIPMAEYDVQQTPENGSIGILDCLFDAIFSYS